MRRGERHAIVGTDPPRQSKFAKESLKHREGVTLFRRRQRFAADQIAGREVRHREGVAVAAGREHELALVVGTPEIIGRHGLGQGGPAEPHPSPPLAGDQSVPIEYRMDRTDGRANERRAFAP